MACLISAMDGRGTLEQDHWAVIYYLRDDSSTYLAAFISQLCNAHGMHKQRVKTLFGNCRAAWRTAGLPNPGAGSARLHELTACCHAHCYTALRRLSGNRLSDANASAFPARRVHRGAGAYPQDAPLRRTIVVHVDYSAPAVRYIQVHTTRHLPQCPPRAHRNGWSPLSPATYSFK